MKQTHTASSPAGKTQRYVCPKKGCCATFVGVVLLLQEVTDKGTGHEAVMKKLKAGKVKVSLSG